MRVSTSSTHLPETMTHPPPPSDPLRNPSTLIIELTTDQALPLAGIGECFVAVGKGSYPGHVGKHCLFIMPVDSQTAAAACGVVTGTHKATKIKTAVSERRATLAPANTP